MSLGTTNQPLVMEQPAVETVVIPVQGSQGIQNNQIPPSSPQETVPSESKGTALVMPDRETNWEAYKQKFESLSFEERIEVERGNYEVEKPQEPVVEEKKDVQKLPGDKPVEDKAVELGIDPEELEKFDPRVKETIKAMQENLDRLSTFDGFENDPQIRRRIEEIKNGKPFRAAEEIKSDFDPNKLVTQRDIEALGLSDNPEAAQLTSNLLAKAYAAGIEEAFNHAENKAENGIQELRRLNEVEVQLNSLMKEQGIESNLPFNHESHPLRQYIDWVADSGISQDYIDKLGPVAQKALYASYLAATGNLDKAFQKVAQTERLKFIKALDKVKQETKTLTKTEKVVTEPINKFGIDVERYLNDQAYKIAVFTKADQTMRRKLEVLATTGKFPG